MNTAKFETVQDLKTIYCNFTIDELEQEKQELTTALANMVSNPEILPRLAMVTSLIEERAAKNG